MEIPLEYKKEAVLWVCNMETSSTIVDVMIMICLTLSDNELKNSTQSKMNTDIKMNYYTTATIAASLQQQ